MRINKYIAASTTLSRRAADSAIAEDRVRINGSVPHSPGQDVTDTDEVTLNGRLIKPRDETITILLNKPVDYVCSRNGQGSHTIYELLTPELQHLQPVGRLDKDSSGLLLMTTDGQLANELTHPRYGKQKVYEATLDRGLQAEDRQAIEQGVRLEDGRSSLQLKQLDSDRQWQITMSEGRNRQIRRTFAAKRYTVVTLQRVQFGEYHLRQLAPTQRFLRV